ncbi:hypothetical protein [Enterovibrio norvegicus]|uniref:hypothetical protein n=1 Tax=Enterovibrio norvegicus TaxID=188144 RepID=UPI000C842A97|nr:hypothetical protein [Enterovibrio norvegicus]PMI30204.1 hypothetical protein BCU47_18650 [Enterovibrio norvegicus]
MVTQNKPLENSSWLPKSDPVKLPPSSSVVKKRHLDLDYSKKLINFEQTTAVLSFKKDTLNMWPMLRHLIWVRYQLKYKKNNNFNKANPFKIFLGPEWTEDIKEAYDFSSIDDLLKEDVDFLFFVNQNGTEQVEIEDKIYHRITDPIYEKASKKYKCKKIQIIRNSNVFDDDYHFETERLLPPLLRTIGYAQDIFIPNNLTNGLKNKLSELAISHKDVNDASEWFFHAYNMYRVVLTKLNPKAVFFVGFDYHMPLSLAARELGIRAIDIQHGVQIGWSPVYNHWTRFPKKGYDMLPTDFFVWGEYDKNKLESLMPHSKVHISGFPWLKKQQGFFEADTSFVEKWLSKYSDKKVGVFTLQDQPSLPEEFIKLSQVLDDYVWLVKRHPKHQNINTDMIEGTYLSNVKLDKLPLFSLMKYVSLNVTECSTSVIEANYFGVKSICFGIKGFEDYKNFIEERSVYHFNLEEDIIENEPQTSLDGNIQREDVQEDAQENDSVVSYAHSPSESLLYFLNSDTINMNVIQSNVNIDHVLAEFVSR